MFSTVGTGDSFPGFLVSSFSYTIGTGDSFLGAFKFYAVGAGDSWSVKFYSIDTGDSFPGLFSSVQ